jgi:mannan endo-1,6-alpha-mannosidase
MYERQCETTVTCDTDQESFKAYFARFLALTIKLAPYTEPIITPWIRTSSVQAAKQCSSGVDGNTCGLKWTTNGVWDGKYGVGEQMAALEVIQSNLIDFVDAPVTNSTGGTSKGNPNAGTGGDQDPTDTADDKPVTTGDRVGAGFSTAIVVVLILGGTAWMII